MIGTVIGIVIAIAAVLLGTKGFAAPGLRLTSKRRRTGTTARVVVPACLLAGAVFIADGLYGVHSITHNGVRYP